MNGTLLHIYSLDIMQCYMQAWLLSPSHANIRTHHPSQIHQMSQWPMKYCYTIIHWNTYIHACPACVCKDLWFLLQHKGRQVGYNLQNSLMWSWTLSRGETTLSELINEYYYLPWTAALEQCWATWGWSLIRNQWLPPQSSATDTVLLGFISVAYWWMYVSAGCLSMHIYNHHQCKQSWFQQGGLHWW